MRVVLLVTDLLPGGTPLRLARIARGLRARGVDVHVGCLAPPGPVSAALAVESIPTFACDARSARDLAALARLVDHLKRIRPDIIHATLTHANVAARLAGWLLGIPVVTSTATIEVERRWHAWAERLTARFDRGHIVNSRALAEHAVRVFHRPRARVHLLPASIGPLPKLPDRADARRALDIAEHEFVVLWVGRFDPVKRIDQIIRCAEILSATPCRFLLAGDGPFRPQVEQMLRLSSAARRVHLLGWQEDLGPLFSAADAFVFPSLTEGMPNAVLAAMACGLPVVASDIPALRELAGGGTQLLLVDGADTKALADGLLSLRDDEPRRRELGRRAAAWAAAFVDERAMLDALIDVYEQTAAAVG